MKFSLIASGLALAASALAVPTSELEKRQVPTFGCLSSFAAKQLVNQYASILQNQSYQGSSPQQTANQIIAANYVEYSDSILSLEKAPLGNTPSATSRAQWVSEVTQHPEQNIQTTAILNSCTQISWFWTFPKAAGGPNEVKGFNLMNVNFEGQITEAQIEFNSIAWGVNTGQIYQYCPAPSS